jgi:beta-1,4-mannosyl-glycoprotein beta-1,4-N-acetylglucosaminyltransferase
MIYDCFTAFNEFELLEIRLNELAGVVDRFVLVEATRTHSNRPKPLYFRDHWSRFAAFTDRIIHVEVADMPGDPNAWVRENFQRNAIARGLTGARDHDVILVSDLDEIPSAASVRAAAGLPGIVGLGQRMCYYYLNFATAKPWIGTRMLPYGLLRQLPAVQLVRSAGIYSAMPNAGWHFSYVGGTARIQEKLEAFAHQEFNTADIRNPAHIAEAIRRGQDLHGRGIQEFAPVELRTLPAYVVENRLRYMPLLWSEFHENWHSEEQCRSLVAAYERTRGLEGDVVEVGCWEGKSTAYLANACYPEEVQAVDTWQGNIDEDPNHATAVLARERDVQRVFRNNMRSLTLGNVRTHVMRSQDFFARQQRAVKFCHLNTAHGYPSVKAEIEAVRKHLMPRGVLCGGGSLSANMQRADLQGGVERAVRELLPGVQSAGNFWFWQRPE